MYFITGSIYENGKLAAYGLYNVKEKKAIIMSKRSVKESVLAGEEVVGFVRYENTINGLGYVRKHRGYMWKNLPELNGKGVPEQEEYIHNKVLIGTNGFKEVRQFVTVNSIGEIKVYSAKDFKEELKNDRITGAVLAEDGRILSKVRNEISDQWLKDSGFKRDDDLVWIKEQAEQPKEPEQRVEPTSYEKERVAE